MNLDRKCYKCGTEFKLRETEKASNICTPCKTAYQRAYARRKVEETPEEDRYKDLYPYDANEKLIRFRKLKKELESINNRDEWRALLKKRLDNLEENEPDLLVWIFDRRDQETKDGIDRIPRYRETYEDTRTTHQNKSWFD